MDPKKQRDRERAKEIRHLLAALIIETSAEEEAAETPTLILAAAIDVITHERPTASLARMVVKELRAAIVLLTQHQHPLDKLSSSARIFKAMSIGVEYLTTHHTDSWVAQLVLTRLRLVRDNRSTEEQK